MTELSVMLISGTLGEGATVTVSVDQQMASLAYNVTSVPVATGKKRTNESTFESRKSAFSESVDGDLDFMED